MTTFQTVCITIANIVSVFLHHNLWSSCDLLIQLKLQFRNNNNNNNDRLTAFDPGQPG